MALNTPYQNTSLWDPVSGKLHQFDIDDENNPYLSGSLSKVQIQATLDLYKYINNNPNDTSIDDNIKSQTNYLVSKVINPHWDEIQKDKSEIEQYNIPREYYDTSGNGGGASLQKIHNQSVSKQTTPQNLAPNKTRYSGSVDVKSLTQPKNPYAINKEDFIIKEGDEDKYISRANGPYHTFGLDDDNNITKDSTEERFDKELIIVQVIDGQLVSVIDNTVEFEGNNVQDVLFTVPTNSRKQQLSKNTFETNVSNTPDYLNLNTDIYPMDLTAMEKIIGPRPQLPSQQNIEKIKKLNNAGFMVYDLITNTFMPVGEDKYLQDVFDYKNNKEAWSIKYEENIKQVNTKDLINKSKDKFYMTDGLEKSMKEGNLALAARHNPIAFAGMMVSEGIDYTDQWLGLGMLNNAYTKIMNATGLQSNLDIDYKEMHKNSPYKIMGIKSDGTVVPISFAGLRPDDIAAPLFEGEENTKDIKSYKIYFNGAEIETDAVHSSPKAAYDTMFDRMSESYWNDKNEGLFFKTAREYELYQEQNYFQDALNIATGITGTLAGFALTGGTLSGGSRLVGLGNLYKNFSPTIQSALMFTAHGMLEYNDPDKWANTTYKELVTNTGIDATLGALLPNIGGTLKIPGLNINFKQGNVITNPNTADALLQMIKGTLIVGGTFEASTFLEEWMSLYSEGVINKEDGQRGVPWSELSPSFYEVLEKYSTKEGVEALVTNLGIAALLHNRHSVKRFFTGGKASAKHYDRWINTSNRNLMESISFLGKKDQIPKHILKKLNNSNTTNDQKLQLQSEIKNVLNLSYLTIEAELETAIKSYEKSLQQNTELKLDKTTVDHLNNLQSLLKFVKEIEKGVFEIKEADLKNLKTKDIHLGILELTLPNGMKQEIRLIDFVVVENGIVNFPKTLNKILGKHPISMKSPLEEKFQGYSYEQILEKIVEPAIKNDIEYKTKNDPTQIKTPLPKVEKVEYTGESLPEISKKYGVDVDKLMAYNNISDVNKIKYGQGLFLDKPKGFQLVTGEPSSHQRLMHNFLGSLNVSLASEINYVPTQFIYGTESELTTGFPGYKLELEDLELMPTNKKQELGFNEKDKIYTVHLAGRSSAIGEDGTIKQEVSTGESATVLVEEAFSEPLYKRLVSLGESRLKIKIQNFLEKMAENIEDNGMPVKEVDIELLSSLFELWALKQNSVALPETFDNYINDLKLNENFLAFYNANEIEINDLMMSFWKVGSKNSEGKSPEEMLSELGFALAEGMVEHSVPTDIKFSHIKEVLTSDTFKLQIRDANNPVLAESEFVNTTGTIENKLELSNASKQELFPEKFAASRPSLEKPSNQGHLVELLEVNQQGLEDWETLVLNSWRPPPGLPENLTPKEWRNVVLKNIFSNNYVDVVLNPKTSELTSIVVPKNLEDINNKLFNLLGIEEDPVTIANTIKTNDVIKVKEKIIKDWNNGKVFEPTNLAKLSVRQIDKKAQDLSKFAKALFNDPKLDIEQGEWWDSGVQFLRESLTDEMPQLAKEDNWALFKMVSGITSQQRELDPNLSLATYAISNYFENGELNHLKPYLRPRKIMHKVKGQKQKVWKGKWVNDGEPMEVNLSLPLIEQQFEKLTLLKEKFGSWESVNNFLIQPTTVKDLRNFFMTELNMSLSAARPWAKNLEGLTTNLVNNDITYPAMMFGPKIGAMIGVQNNLELSVNDLWMARFAQIGFGELIKDEAITPVLNKIIDKAMEKTGKDLGISVRGVQAITWVAMKDLFGMYGGKKTTDDYITAIKRRKQRYEDFITTRPLEGANEARNARAFRRYDIGDDTYRKEFKRGDVSFKLKRSRLKNKIIESSELISKDFPNGIKGQSLINVLLKKYQISPEQIKWLDLPGWVKKQGYKPNEKLPIDIIQQKLNEDPLNIRHIYRGNEQGRNTEPNISGDHKVWSESLNNSNTLQTGRIWDTDATINSINLKYRQGYSDFLDKHLIDIAKLVNLDAVFADNSFPDVFTEPRKFYDWFNYQYHTASGILESMMKQVDASHPIQTEYLSTIAAVRVSPGGIQNNAFIWEQTEGYAMRDWTYLIKQAKDGLIAMSKNERKGKEFITKDYYAKTTLAKHLVQKYPNEFIGDGPFIKVLETLGLDVNNYTTQRKNLTLANYINSLFTHPNNYQDPTTQVSASQSRLITNKRLMLKNTPKKLWSEIGKTFYKTDSSIIDFLAPVYPTSNYTSTHYNHQITWNNVDLTKPLAENLIDRLDKIAKREIAEKQLGFYLADVTSSKGVIQSSYGTLSDKKYTVKINNWKSESGQIDLEKAYIEMYNSAENSMDLWKNVPLAPLNTALNKEGFHSSSYGGTLDNYKAKFSRYGGFTNTENSKDYHEFEVLTARNNNLIDNISQIPESVVQDFMENKGLTNKADVAVDDLIKFANGVGEDFGEENDFANELQLSNMEFVEQGHFKEPNVIGHIRGNYVEPKVWSTKLSNYETLPFKFSFIGELQSDWSQQYNQGTVRAKPPFPSTDYLKPLIKNYISEAVKNGANGVLLNGGLQNYSDWYGALDGMKHKFIIPTSTTGKQIDTKKPYTYEPADIESVNNGYYLNIDLQIKDSNATSQLSDLIVLEDSPTAKLQNEFYTKLAGRMVDGPVEELEPALNIIASYINKKLLADPSYEIVVYKREMNQDSFGSKVRTVGLILPKEFVNLIIQNKTLKDFNHSYNNRKKMTSNNHNEVNVTTSTIKDLTPDGLQQPFLLKHYDEVTVNVMSKMLKPFGIKPQLYWLDYQPEHMTLQKFAKAWEFTNDIRHPLFKNFKILEHYNSQLNERTGNYELQVPFIGYSFIKGEGKKDFKKFIQEENFNSFKLKTKKLTEKQKSEIYNQNTTKPSFLEQTKLRIKASKDRAKNNFSSTEEFAKTINRTYRPVTSVLKGIGNPVFKRTVRKQVTNAMLKKGQWNSEAQPFIKDIIALESKNYPAYENLSLALFNGDIEMVEKIFTDNNLDIANYSSIIGLTDNVYESAISLGTDIHKLDNYFPRRVKDVKSLWNHLGIDIQSEYEGVKRQKELELGKTLSDAEEESLLESFLRGYVPRGTKKPGYTKSRSVELLNRDMLPYYDKPQDALLNYIDSFGEYLSVAETFGAGNIDESVGKWVNEQYQLGNIKGEHIDKAKNIISEHYASADHSAWVMPVKNIIYVLTMGSITSALTQIGDQTWAMQETGILNTLKNDIKALLGTSKIKLKDINVENIMYELSTQSKSGKLVANVFKAAGIKFMDSLGKESLVNGVYDKYQTLAKNGKYEGFLSEFNTDKDLRRLDEYFTAEDKIQLFEELRSGEITPLIKELVLNVLLDWQPVAKSEVPSNYKKHPLWYQLKTYTIKQLNSFKDNAVDDISLYSKQMNNAKTPKEKKDARELLEQAVLNLLKLVGVFVGVNGLGDAAKDKIMKRGVEFKDIGLQQLYKILGASRYLQFQAENEGLPMAVFKQIAPATIGVSNDFYRDVVGKQISKYTPENKIGLLPRFLDNKRYKQLKNEEKLNKEETIELEKLEHKLKIPWFYQSLSLKFIPILGKPLYWHKGLGRQKTIQRKLWKYRSDSEELDLQPLEKEDYINTALYGKNENYLTDKQWKKEVANATGYTKYRKIMNSGEWNGTDVKKYRESIKSLLSEGAIDASLYHKRLTGIDKFYEDKFK